MALDQGYGAEVDGCSNFVREEDKKHRRSGAEIDDKHWLFGAPFVFTIQRPVLFCDKRKIDVSLIFLSKWSWGTRSSMLTVSG
jgi:hypothetical protein